MTKAVYTQTKDGLLVELHVQPGASSAGFAGVHADALKLRVTSRATDGQANQAVIKFLADYFQVPKTCVSITRGHSSRRKTILVVGEVSRLAARLASLL